MMTRTDRRRFPVLLAVIAALAMAMLFSPVQAQEGSVPDQPTGLEATATHDSVTLTWDDPGDDTITGYVVLRRVPAVDPQGYFNELVSNTGTATTTYTDDTVAAETRYTYRIKAINEHGVSERSRWFHINVPAAPEAAEGDEQDGEGGGGSGGPGKRANVSEGGTDCSGDTATTCEVDVGGSVTGNIGFVGDGDYFRVDLEAGTRYQIDLEGADTGRGTLADPALVLYDESDSYLLGDDNNGVGDNARMIYTPTTAGTYYLFVEDSLESVTGTYTLSVIVLGANGASEADTDFPATTATTGRVDVGASATGNLSTVTDEDWFKVVLAADKTYQIDMKGVDGGGGTMGDPYLHDIRDSSGTGISNTGNDDVDADNDIYDSQITYTPTTAGAYYLVAAGASDSGTYTLSVGEVETEEPPCTLNDGDFWCGVVTVGPILSGTNTIGHGYIEFSGISGGSFEGETEFTVGSNNYTFEGIYVSSTGGTTGALNFKTVALFSDDDKEALELHIDVDGTSSTRAISDAVSGVATGLILWTSAGLDWSLATTVTARLRTPPSDDPVDDCPGDATTTCEVDVGGSATGNIETVTDRDWFKVDLEAGKFYQIDLEGDAGGGTTLEDPYLRNIRDSSGAEISETENDDVDPGSNADSRVIFNPTEAGAYYLVASGYGGASDTGTYTLSVTELETRTEEGGTDFIKGTTTLGLVEVGDSATGEIDPASDIDWFRVVLEYDKTYVFDLEGSETSSGTLANPFLALLDASGRISYFEDDDGGQGLNSRFELTAVYSGIHYLSASKGASASSGGTYTLSVREVTTPSTPGFGEGVAVLLSNLGQDTDEFASAAVGAFDAAQGFTTGSARSGYFLDSIKLDVKEVPNTPADVTVQLWSASNGNPDASIATLTHSTGSWDTGVNTFSASPAQVLAATTKYFVVLLYSGARTYLNVNITQIDSADDASTEWEVTGRRLERGSDNQWRRVSGQYLKFSVGGRVTAEGGTDLPANATTSGVVEVDGSAARGDIYEPVFVERTGDDDVDGWDFDTDWFAVELKAGRTYRIDMKGALLSSDTDLTLRLPEITAIYDADGNFLVNTWYSDESDSHYLFRVTFNASTDGTYYIAASGESHEWGTYKLRVKDITEDDDEHTAAQRGLKNLRAVEEKGGVRLTWQPPDGAAVTGYRIERRRAGGQDSGPQRSHGQPRDHHTLVEDTGNTETSYVDESAEQGVEYEYRVTARNESGPGEESDWVRAGPASASNNPATGAPTISGTTQVGETLTADISGIADADGLSGETFTYQWVSSDGTTDTDIENATGSTYTLIAADQGKAIKVRVTFTDDAGNAETLTSTPTEPVLGDGPPGAPRNLTATAGNKEITLSWEPPDDNGNAPATRYRIEWRVDGKDYDKNHWGTARSTTYTTNDQANLANGVKYFFRVKAENDDGNSYGPYGPASEEVSATPTSGSAVDLGTPVLSDTETLHHGMVKLDWQDIEDAGWYVVQYYHVEDEEWLDLPAEGVDIAFHGSSAVVSNLHGLSWLRVGAASCAGSSEWSQIEQLFGTNASDWEGVPVPEVEEGDEIEPCPVVLGTPVLSDTETLHHGMVQLDWEDIEDAGWYVVQYYHVDGGSGEWLDLPAAGVDIAFHGSSAVVSNLHGLSWLRVRAMSCAGESEWSQIEQSFGTNASDWEGVPVPEVAEGDEIEPCSEDADTPDNSPATGAPTIGGTAQVGQTLTSNTSGIADADGLTNVSFTYQWLADDTDIAGASGSTYTLTDSEESKAIKVEVSFTDDAGNDETLTSTATDAVAGAQPTEPPDKPTGLEATASHDSVTLTWDDPGDDSITGYVILRRIPGVDSEGHFDVLVADTGTAATTYTDNTVAAETRYTYRIKAINGAGTSERSRWSHIDTPAAPVPNKPTGLEATESDGQVVLTWDDPGDDSITGYVILRRVRENNTGGDFSVLVADTGSAATTYTDDTVAAETRYTYRIKAINEHGTSERSRWFHIDIPAAP